MNTLRGCVRASILEGETNDFLTFPVLALPVLAFSAFPVLAYHLYAIYGMEYKHTMCNILSRMYY